MRKKLLCFIVMGSVVFLSFGSATAYEKDLGRIIVTATRIAQHDYKIAGNVTIIDKEDIEASNAQTIPDILKETLGLNVFDNSTTKTSKLDIRGFGETAISNVLVLVNDRKTNSIDLSGSDLLQIPIEAVERIEIIRGAGSVLYGDNAVGGVVNIITKKGKGDLTGQIGSYYGSYDRRGVDMEISGEQMDISYYLYSKYADDRGYRQNSDVLTKDFNGRLAYDFTDRLSMDLDLGWHEDDYGQPGSLTDSTLESLGRRGSSNEGDRASTKDRFASLAFDFDPSPEDFYLGHFIMDFNFRNRDTYTDNEAWALDTRNDIDTYGLSGKYIFDRTVFNQDLNCVVGLDYYDHENEIFRVSASSPADITISKEELGIYGFAEFEFVDNLYVNGGTRFHKADYKFSDRNTALDTAKDPDVWVSLGGLRYEYAKGSNIHISFQETFRFLATDEWYNSISGALNIDLKQQTGQQYEIGVKHNFDDAFTLSVTPYWIDIENEIYYNPSGGLFGFGANENYDKTRRVGVEVGMDFDLLRFVDVEFLDKLEFFSNYTYQRPKFRDGTYDGKFIPFVPEHIASHGFNVKFWDHFTFSLTGKYVGSRFAGSDTDNSLSRVEPYYVIDNKIAYQEDNFEVFAEINNINNAKYSTFVSSYDTTKYYYPAPEKNFNIGVNVKF